MRNKAITKEGIEKLLKIKELSKELLYEMENLKATELKSDWIKISLASIPCHYGVSKFVEFIENYLSNSNND